MKCIINLRTSSTQLWTHGFYHTRVVMCVDVSCCQSVVMSAYYFVTLVGLRWGFENFYILAFFFRTLSSLPSHSYGNLLLWQQLSSF